MLHAATLLAQEHLNYRQGPTKHFFESAEAGRCCALPIWQGHCPSVRADVCACMHALRRRPLVSNALKASAHAVAAGAARVVRSRQSAWTCPREEGAGSSQLEAVAARQQQQLSGGHMLQRSASGLLMNPLLSLAQSSGGSGQGGQGGQGLSRMTSQEEAAASMRREPSTELRMGGVSLADIMQQCAAVLPFFAPMHDYLSQSAPPVGPFTT